MIEGKKSKMYHGMTIEQIRSKYYINVTGNESSSEIKYINGKLSRLYQDVNYYYTDTKASFDLYKDNLRRIDEDMQLAEAKVKWKYIIENKALASRDKWSDDARDTAAIIETRTAELISNLNTIKEQLNEIVTELTVWKEVKQNLDFISGRIDSTGYSISTEAKYLRREPGNVPDSSRDNNDGPIDDGKKSEMF